MRENNTRFLSVRTTDCDCLILAPLGTAEVTGLVKGAWRARGTGLGASVGAVVGEGCLWPKVRGA